MIKIVTTSLKVISISLIIGLWQGMRLKKEKNTKELIVFVSMMLIATVYAIIVLLDFPLVSPIQLITDIINRIWEYI